MVSLSHASRGTKRDVARQNSFFTISPEVSGIFHFPDYLDFPDFLDLSLADAAFDNTFRLARV